MGYFTITLVNNIEGEVRWGKVTKLNQQLFKLLMPWRKFNHVRKRGYLVTLKSAFIKETNYRLFRTKEGHWSQDMEGKVLLEQPIVLAIRQAIEDYEKTSK